MGNGFSKEYAAALFSVSLEKGIINDVAEEFSIIANAFSENHMFIKLMSHPQLGADEKREIIETVFKNINTTLRHFLLVLIDNKRIVDILSIKNVFEDMYNEYNEILPVIAKTTVPLTKEETDLLEKKLVFKFQ